MYCNKCRAHNGDTNKFCEKCGNHLEGLLNNTDNQFSNQPTYKTIDANADFVQT